MSRARATFLQILLAALVFGSIAFAQQDPPASETTPAQTDVVVEDKPDSDKEEMAEDEPEAVVEGGEVKHRRGPRPQEVVQVRGEAINVKKGETVGNIVVVAGKLRMEGEVDGDIVAVASEAFIDGIVRGSVVVVPGPVKFGPNADVRREGVVVGSYERDPAARINNFQPVPVPNLVPLIGGINEFVFEGVLMMRPLPPTVRWVWIAYGAMLLFLLGLALLFPKPVMVGAQAIAERPVVSMFSGFLSVILFIPVLLVLIVTVVGIVAVPFAFAGLALAALFGKAAVLAYLGQQVGRNLRLAVLESPLLAMLVGALILAALYMVPVLGLLIWLVATLLGLGAIMVATASALNNQPSEPTPVGVPIAPTVATATTAPAAPPIEGVIAPAPVSGATSTYYKRVGFWKRTFAALLDWLLLLIPLVALGFSGIGGPFIPVVAIAYFVCMWTWKGTSIGKICLGLKIVRTDGSDIDFPVALVRSLASCFSFMVLLLGFFWAGWDREKQSWHDKIAGTIVVQVPKGVSLL